MRTHFLFKALVLSCALLIANCQLSLAQTTWTSRTSAADNSWNSICYGNGLFVAVASSGTGNRVMTSPDGITWTSQTTPVDNNWTSVTYGNGLFVAVSNTGTLNRAMTSPDGVTWTGQTTPSSNNWNSVIYANGKFTAVSRGAGSPAHCLMSSTDGATWTIGSNGLNFTSPSLAYGNSTYVGVGSGPVYAITSTDGSSVTLRTAAANTQWYSVTYGNGIFVAVGSSAVMTSSDGITWTSRTPAANLSWRSVTYAHSMFVAVASSGTGNRVMTSPDGITWTSQASATNNNWTSVAYGNGRFVAVAGSGTGNRVMTSELDAIVWDGSENSNWGFSDNWVGDVAPTETDNVRIPSGTPNEPSVFSPDVPIACNNLIVQNGATLTLEGGHNFNINGQLENEGTVIVETDPDLGGIGSLITYGGITGSGDFQMEQSLLGAGGATPNGVFQYVSSPVAGATSATYSAAGTDKLWSANEAAQNYTEITDDATALNVGQGYVARVGADGEVIFTGTAFNTGNVSIAGLTRTGTSESNRGYNLVGNPYPSSVDWNSVSTTDLEPTIWLRTHTPGLVMTTDTYNATSGIGTDNNGNGELTGYIAPTQAFWVRVDADGNTGQIDFTNADRVHNYWASIYKQAAEEGTVRLALSDGDVSDETIVHFTADAQDSFDDFDSHKMWMDNIPQLYTTAGEDSLTINGLFSIETNPIVDLGIKAPTAGDHTITATSITLTEEVWLEDRALNVFQHLNVNPVYAFATNSGNIGDRFALHFGMMAVGVDGDAINRVSTVFATDGVVNVSVGEDAGAGTITILDMAGRTVQTSAINGSRTVVATDLNTGIYLVRVETEKGADTHRVLLR